MESKAPPSTSHLWPSFSSITCNSEPFWPVAAFTSAGRPGLFPSSGPNTFRIRLRSCTPCFRIEYASGKGWLVLLRAGRSGFFGRRMMTQMSDFGDDCCSCRIGFVGRRMLMCTSGFEDGCFVVPACRAAFVFDLVEGGICGSLWGNGVRLH